MFLQASHSQDIENKCKSNVYMIIHGFLQRPNNNSLNILYNQEHKYYD